MARHGDWPTGPQLIAEIEAFRTASGMDKKAFATKAGLSDSIFYNLRFTSTPGEGVVARVRRVTGVAMPKALDPGVLHEMRRSEKRQREAEARARRLGQMAGTEPGAEIAARAEADQQRLIAERRELRAIADRVEADARARRQARDLAAAAAAARVTQQRQGSRA